MAAVSQACSQGRLKSWETKFQAFSRLGAWHVDVFYIRIRAEISEKRLGRWAEIRTSRRGKIRDFDSTKIRVGCASVYGVSDRDDIETTRDSRMSAERSRWRCGVGRRGVVTQKNLVDFLPLHVIYLLLSCDKASSHLRLELGFKRLESQVADLFELEAGFGLQELQESTPSGRCRSRT